MRTIRASEIGTYLFCARAWWYHAQGEPSENQGELAGGSIFHAQHGRQVMRASLASAVGLVLLFVALVALTIAITLQLLPQ